MTLQEVEVVLEQEVRPLLRSHGGNVRLDNVQNGIVRIELLGACSGCPSADLSTRGIIEDILKSHFDCIHRVELVYTIDPDVLELARKILRHEV